MARILPPGTAFRVANERRMQERDRRPTSDPLDDVKRAMGLVGMGGQILGGIADVAAAAGTGGGTVQPPAQPAQPEAPGPISDTMREPAPEQTVRQAGEFGIQPDRGPGEQTLEVGAAGTLLRDMAPQPGPLSPGQLQAPAVMGAPGATQQPAPTPLGQPDLSPTNVQPQPEPQPDPTQTSDQAEVGAAQNMLQPQAPMASPVMVPISDVGQAFALAQYAKTPEERAYLMQAVGELAPAAGFMDMLTGGTKIALQQRLQRMFPELPKPMTPIEQARLIKMHQDIEDRPQDRKFKGLRMTGQDLTNQLKKQQLEQRGRLQPLKEANIRARTARARRAPGKSGFDKMLEWWARREGLKTEKADKIKGEIWEDQRKAQQHMAELHARLKETQENLERTRSSIEPKVREKTELIATAENLLSRGKSIKANLNKLPGFEGSQYSPEGTLKTKLRGWIGKQKKELSQLEDKMVRSTAPLQREIAKIKGLTAKQRAALNQIADQFQAIDSQDTAARERFLEIIRLLGEGKVTFDDFEQLLEKE